MFRIDTGVLQQRSETWVDRPAQATRASAELHSIYSFGLDATSQIASALSFRSPSRMFEAFEDPSRPSLNFEGVPVCIATLP